MPAIFAAAALKHNNDTAGSSDIIIWKAKKINSALPTIAMRRTIMRNLLLRTTVTAIRFKMATMMNRIVSMSLGAATKLTKVKINIAIESTMTTLLRNTTKAIPNTEPRDGSLCLFTHVRINVI